MVGKLSPGQNGKVFGQAFFKKLAGDKRGRRPLLCSAARNAKQKETVPAKNSEANFWRPRFTRPLRAGKRANANFACSEGFFLSGVPRHMAGWPFLRGLPLLRRLLRPVSRRVFPAAALAAVREACCNRVRLLRRCFPAHTPPAAFAPGLRCPPRGLLVVCPLCAEGAGFLLFFTRSPRKALPFSAGVSRLCSPSEGFTFCRCCGGFCTRCLFALRAALDARFSFVFCLFLFGCCRANFFSFVAQAATGIFFLARILRRDVPARGSCHLLLFRGLLRPLPVFPFCIVRTGFLFCFSPFPA